jgi:hypothetical protein
LQAVIQQRYKERFAVCCLEQSFVLRRLGPQQSRTRLVCVDALKNSTPLGYDDTVALDRHRLSLPCSKKREKSPCLLFPCIWETNKNTGKHGLGSKNCSAYGASSCTAVYTATHGGMRQLRLTLPQQQWSVTQQMIGSYIGQRSRPCVY